MLYTTEKQKELLRKIVEDYDDYGKIGDKYILRIVLDVTNNAALEWDLDDSVTALYNDNPNKMLDFIGCIGLIDYLLKNNLIYIHSSRRNLSANKHVVATNAATIEQVIEFIGVENAKPFGNSKYFYKMTKGTFAVLTNKSVLRTDLCKKVDFLGDSLVYPMPYLVDYVNNGFKTEEQMRFEKQMSDTQSKHEQAIDKAEKTLSWTRWAFIVALASTIVAIGFNIYSLRDMTIRELNTTIKEQKLPEVINTRLTDDTIKAFVVNQQNGIELIQQHTKQ